MRYDKRIVNAAAKGHPMEREAHKTIYKKNYRASSSTYLLDLASSDFLLFLKLKMIMKIKLLSSFKLLRQP